jgi:hypothetical protein
MRNNSWTGIVNASYGDVDHRSDRRRQTRRTTIGPVAPKDMNP